MVLRLTWLSWCAYISPLNLDLKWKHKWQWLVAQHLNTSLANPGSLSQLYIPWTWGVPYIWWTLRWKCHSRNNGVWCYPCSQGHMHKYSRIDNYYLSFPNETHSFLHSLIQNACTRTLGVFAYFLFNRNNPKTVATTYWKSPILEFFSFYPNCLN